MPSEASSGLTVSSALAAVMPGAKTALEKETMKVALQTRTEVNSLAREEWVVSIISTYLPVSHAAGHAN